MGSQTTTQQQKYTPTATETALMNNELAVSNAALPGQISNTVQSQGLVGDLLQGGSLPGYLNTLPGGVSQGQSQNEAQMGLQGLATQFQQMGGLDSGSFAQAGANSYANTLNSNAQFNVENLANLLNLASGQAYQNAGLTQSNNASLGTQSGALAGSNSSSTIFANPFSQAISAVGAVGSLIPKPGVGSCWVASEIFGGWYNFNTVMARFYVNFLSPKWFKNFYLKYGERIAKFISNKQMLKNILKPLFEYFVSQSKEKLNVRPK
jgi:hypothetical protein